MVLTTTPESTGSSAGPVATEPPPAAPRSGPAWLPTLAWFVATALFVVLAALLPLLRDHRFYFVDDSQSGAYGIWYELGRTLRAGHFPSLLLPQRWEGGDIAAEGQWGLWNPLVLGIGWFVSGVGSAVVAVTLVKVVLLLVGGTGVFALVRTYRVAPAWCAVAGVTATMTGFTGYVDGPSWVTGLMTWALLPWFWAALRRVVLHGANPLPALVAGYLVVTVGYLNGTLALIAVLLGVGVALLVQRRWTALLPLVGVGVFCGLVALTIYLPGVLTQSVTTRSSGDITNSQLLNADLTDVATSAIATARPTVVNFTSAVASAPLLYITWALPLVTLVDLRRACRGAAQVADLFVLGAVSAAFVLGPSELGPLRFPDRMVPFVATTAIVLLVIGLGRARVARPGLGRLLGALGLLLASYYLTWASTPQGAPHAYAKAALGAAVGLVLVWALTRLGPRVLARGLTTVVALVVILVSFGLDDLQHASATQSILSDFGAPSRASGYTSQLAGARGGVLVVGQLTPSATVRRTPEVWHESLLANTWFVNRHAVMGTYSPVGFAAYNAAMCTNWRGETCAALFGKLFAPQPVTGLPLVDQLSVSTLQIYRDTAGSADLAAPPAGWHVLRAQRYTVTWVRDHPLPTAGGVVWSSPGTRVTTVSRDDRSVTLHVQAATSGSRVVLSRLAWPGYEVSGASGARIGPKVAKYLLSLDLPASASGRTVTVRFSPPGWHAEVGATLLAAVAGLLWSVAAGVWVATRGARRRAATRRAAGRGAVAAA